MNINSDGVFSMTQAMEDFSSVTTAADRFGEAVVYKNNRPRYLVINMENSDYLLDLTEDEKIDVVAKRILKKHILAFRELAK